MQGVEALLVSPLKRPAFNLAAEEYLFTQRGDTVLFLYINTPAVVLGSNQALHSEVDTLYAAAQGIPVLRRLSGGGAVYHDVGNLNVCLLGNRASGRYPLDEGVTRPLYDALAGMGLPITVGVRNDLWVEGGKIAGTASHFNRTRRLHHATLLYDADLTTLQAVLKAHHPAYSPQKGQGIASVSSPVINLKVYLTARHQPTLSTPDFFEQLTVALLNQFKLDTVTAFSQKDLDAIHILECDKYTQAAWTEKR